MKLTKFIIIISLSLISAQRYTFSFNSSDLEMDEMNLQSTYFSLNDIHKEFKESIFLHLAINEFIHLSHTSKDWRKISYAAGRNVSIDLSHKKLTIEDCKALMWAPFSSLILRYCQLNQHTVSILLRSSMVDRIPNGIIEKNRQALADNKFTIIKKLDLSYNYLTFIDLNCLNIAQLDFLESLNLMSNCMGSEGIAYLAKANLPKLKSLNLFDNDIGDEGVKNLAAAPFISHISTLSLCKNSIGNMGAKYLASMNSSALTSLNLYFNDINAEGIKYLTAAPFCANLIDLNLSDNFIGREGIAYLANAKFPKLTSLNVSYNNISSAGMAYLTNAPFKSNLQHLDLSHNAIGVEGTEHITIRKFPHLKLLNLIGNHIDINEFKQIKLQLPHTVVLDSNLSK